MDMTFIEDIVSNCIFPIIMCLILLKQINENNDRHEKEVDKLSDVVNANTLVVQQLVDKLQKE